jgi:hypothetical protein
MPKAEHVIKAIKECDKKGLDEFLNHYGFRREIKYTLIYHGRKYPSKAIWGVAYKYSDGQALTSDEFHGGINRGCAAYELLQLGFQILNKKSGALLNKNPKH